MPTNDGVSVATETVAVDDLNQFVMILTAWHAEKVAVLQHMLTIPEGTEFTIADEETGVLEGDILDGFKAGINLALMELGVLPFTAEMDEDEAAPVPT